MNKEEYQCSACGGVFQKGRSDEEAEQESREIWGEIPQEDKTIICDDCFKSYLKKLIESIIP